MKRTSHSFRRYRLVITLFFGMLTVGFISGCEQAGAVAGAALVGAADAANANNGHPTNYGEQYLQALKDAQDANDVANSNSSTSDDE